MTKIRPKKVIPGTLFKAQGRLFLTLTPERDKTAWCLSADDVERRVVRTVMFEWSDTILVGDTYQMLVARRRHEARIKKGQKKGDESAERSHSQAQERVTKKSAKKCVGQRTSKKCAILRRSA